MAGSTATQPRLVGDIGGTNTRLALYAPESGSLHQVRNYTNRDYSRLEDILDAWLQDWKGQRPTACCLAVAAPPFKDTVSMLNMDWSFSVSGVKRQFGFTSMRCINDFQGNAFALPHLQSADLHTLRTGGATDCRKLATVGPGTGLGGATLECHAGAPLATASEPGHMGLSPATPLELAAFALLCEQYSEVYAELILSGPGLLRLYQTLAQVHGQTAQAQSPAEVSRRAIDGSCALCTETLQVFCALLGSLCGDYVLATGSYGGVYLAGGIIPQMLDFLSASDFQRRFDSKGEMAAQLAKTPLHAIVSGTTGLLGAAHAPLEEDSP